MNEQVWLYILTFWWGAKGIERIRMPDMETCQSAIESSEAYISNGDENEAGAVLFCAGSERQWKGSDGFWRNNRVLDND